MNLQSRLVWLFPFLLTLVFTPPVAAADKSSPRSAVEKKAQGGESSARPLPFRGNLKATDKAANTITIGSRVFDVTTATRFYRAGRTVRLEDGVKGEWVTGSYRRQDGKLVANTVYFGGKQETGSSQGASRPGKE